jgi:hypothetical protein
MSLLGMQNYFNDWERTSKNEYNLSVLCSGGYQLDWMRNEVTERALESGHDLILYLDTDMTFPAETIPRMLITLESNPDFNAVCGVYTYKTPPYAPQLYLSWNKNSHSYNAIRSGFPMERPFPLEACGAGILMVKAEVFKNKPRPWFKFIKSNEREDLPNGLGEDLYFHYYLKPKLLCDPKLICNHHSTTSACLDDYIAYNGAKIKNGVISLTKAQLNRIEKKMDKASILKD